MKAVAAREPRMPLRPTLPLGLTATLVTTPDVRPGWKPDRDFKTILRDVQRAEIERLRRVCEAQKAERKRLRAKRKRLRAERERWRLQRKWLRELERTRKELARWRKKKPRRSD
jgi:hypothetical protein